MKSYRVAPCQLYASEEDFFFIIIIISLQDSRNLKEAQTSDSQAEVGHEVISDQGAQILRDKVATLLYGRWPAYAAG